jgi:hypothetical protein
MRPEGGSEHPLHCTARTFCKSRSTPPARSSGPCHPRGPPRSAHRGGHRRPRASGPRLSAADHHCACWAPPHQEPILRFYWLIYIILYYILYMSSLLKIVVLTFILNFFPSFSPSFPSVNNHSLSFHPSFTSNCSPTAPQLLLLRPLEMRPLAGDLLRRAAHDWADRSVRRWARRLYGLLRRSPAAAAAAQGGCQRKALDSTHLKSSVEGGQSYKCLIFILAFDQSSL